MGVGLPAQSQDVLIRGRYTHLHRLIHKCAFMFIVSNKCGKLAPPDLYVRTVLKAQIHDNRLCQSPHCHAESHPKNKQYPVLCGDGS